MYYIIAFILINMVFVSILIYNLIIKNQNEINEQNAIDFDKLDIDEEYKPKRLLTPAPISAIIWLNIAVLFGVFIASRISLCNLSENEYKNQVVIIPNEELTIDVNNNNYLMYVDKQLVGFDMNYMDVEVDNNITTPYIKDYYKRTIKNPVKNYKHFFLYNRKEVKIGEWVKTFDNCGCGQGDLTLILPKEYKINTK